MTTEAKFCIRDGASKNLIHGRIVVKVTDRMAMIADALGQLKDSGTLKKNDDLSLLIDTRTISAKTTT